MYDGNAVSVREDRSIVRILPLVLLALVMCMVLDRRPDPPGVVQYRTFAVSQSCAVPPSVLPGAVSIPGACEPGVMVRLLAGVRAEVKAHANQLSHWSLAADSSPPA